MLQKKIMHIKHWEGYTLQYLSYDFWGNATCPVPHLNVSKAPIVDLERRKTLQKC